MTIKELMEQLASLDPDLELYAHGGDEDIFSVTGVKIKYTKPDPDTTNIAYGAMDQEDADEEWNKKIGLITTIY